MALVPLIFSFRFPDPVSRNSLTPTPSFLSAGHLQRETEGNVLNPDHCLNRLPNSWLGEDFTSSGIHPENAEAGKHRRLIEAGQHQP